MSESEEEVKIAVDLLSNSWSLKAPKRYFKKYPKSHFPQHAVKCSRPADVEMEVENKQPNENNRESNNSEEEHPVTYIQKKCKLHLSICSHVI